MRTSSASIRSLFVVVLIVAVDCYLVHDWNDVGSLVHLHGWPLPFRLGYFGSALMANLVMFGGSILLPRRGDGRPFLTGFVVAGALSILVIPGLSLLLPWDWFIPLFKAINDQSWSIYRNSKLGMSYSDFFEACISLVYGGLFFFPELLIATMGGLLAHRFARRTPRAVPVVHDATPA
jgi:hypothetical protein